MKRNLVIALAAGLLASSCGGEILSIWKVSIIEGSKPASCFKDGKPTSTTTETTTIHSYAGNWELYAAAGDKFQLRIGDMVLDGTANGDAYTFQGLTTESVKDRLENTTMTLTASTEIFITMNISGDTFTGTVATTDETDCEGTACSATFSADHPDCTITDQIKGTKVPFETFHGE
ncbi:MAG: hypothetical protein HY901_22945 [Deltaproteobacteria bacterium]|nr:hypothetical protein [Deltaproteobacteria bacterium]